ncbi:hypothetical protein ACX51_12610 [Lacticaseibacillus paracasei]|uniref:Uncharacterized protein n=1 Tax=Lacticaseibacillus paracasei TaxID=1597 RepID=A0ABD6VY39_LACPA|nr:hypothetical protein ACX51_12610 [Lacticaseibacillus paracasei]
MLAQLCWLRGGRYDWADGAARYMYSKKGLVLTSPYAECVFMKPKFHHHGSAGTGGDLQVYDTGTA